MSLSASSAKPRAFVEHPIQAQPPIEDYAVIGDCQSAALVSRAGSIDWLCWPLFDSPAIFCTVVDAERGGFFSMRPAGSSQVTRSYLGDTAVLSTRFQTSEADFELIDAMPIGGPTDAETTLAPEHEIVRILRCNRGAGDVDIEFHPRTGFAQWNDKLRDRGALGIRVETRRGLLTLRADVPLQLDADAHGARARRRLGAGESIHVSLTWTANSPVVLPPLGDWTRSVIDRTCSLWTAWSAQTTYSGAYRDHVIRSAIVVRMLSFAPSGAVVAAATSSLPETRGGRNNWDYRFCWLRDAAFTVRGMLALGHAAEAIGFANWLLHATRLTQPRLLVLYDVFGRAPRPERTLDNLRGYQGAVPVQTGNGADGQVQLDVYGEVVDAVWRITVAGHHLDRTSARTMEAFGRYVCAHWTEPDAGIWEPREAPQHHTHSLVLCWSALDRLIDLQQRGELRSKHRPMFESVRGQIRSEVETRGFNTGLGSYTSTLDGETLDATSLLFSWYGFEEAAGERMRSTSKAVMAKLSPAPGLIFRNIEAHDDGTFGICCFWLAEHLALGGGTLDEARTAFEATLAFVNDVGIFAEQIEPATGAALGNTPQTFTHVGLINAALSIAERERREAGHEPEPARQSLEGMLA